MVAQQRGPEMQTDEWEQKRTQQIKEFYARGDLFALIRQSFFKAFS
jgi:hypothetical protein